MHSSHNTIRLPSIEDIERFHGELNEEESGQDVDIDGMIREAQKERDRILSAAHEEAARTLERAKADGEKLRASQGNLGYLEGKQRGEAEAKAALEEQRAEFQQEMDTLHSYREQMFDAVKRNVAECISMLCKKIIMRDFDRDDQVVMDMIDYFYGLIKERSELVIRVSQDDFNKLDMSVIDKRGISVKVDEAFFHGDLMISCDAQSINFGLEQQFEKIDEALGVENDK